MQPIKTTNAMNPAPAKGIESFPTPVIDDVVIAEVVNAWKGDYQKLEYGTLWKDVSHAPNQGSFPEHKLVFQQPTSEDGQWIKRIWVNDRANQDSYNYAIKYSAGSQDHPIYIRNYVVLRETYAPLPDGTPDPLFPIAVLVDEEANRIEGDLDSKYISVTRVYETLPGPAVPTKRYNERGDLETVLVQTVPPNTPPDQDGLLVTGSQVEQVETGKGVKTTSTVQDHSLLQIKEKKEGLLGETITTDDIVSPSTNPDALSQTIVSSVVEQFSATKARKRTTTASGPTSLTQKSNDGKLLGDVTSTESIVAPATNPDAVSPTILSSEIKQIDSGKAVKTNVVLNSTPTLSSNQNSEGLLGNKQVVESIVPAGTAADALSQTILSSSVESIDSIRSKKTTITSTGPATLSGNQNKEGLLGEVAVVESIVAAGTSADVLSETIISSQVDPIDSAKSKKTTITSTGPTSLTQKSKDGKLLGDITSTQSVVAPSSNPDAVSSTILSSEVRQVDSGKAIKTNVVLNSTPTLSGKQGEQGLLGVKSTVESIVPAGTSEDPLSLSVISSAVEPIDSVRSRKVTVSSLGPLTLSGGQNKDGLLGETTVAESIVTAGSNPDALSQTVVSSVIEPIDSAKSRKVTITSIGPTTLSGGQKKDGLLGETTVTEEIVAAGTEPDTLTETIVSSVVDPIDSSKSKKTTITATGPTSLTQASKDGKLLGDVSITESIVSPSEAPDSPDSLILESEVKQIDLGKAIKRTSTLNSTPTLLGGQSGEGLLGNKSTTESIVAAGTAADAVSLSVISSAVEPIDSIRSRKITIESTGPTTLSGGQKKDGLLGETTVTEEIVAAGTDPDALSESIISSVVDPIDSSKSKKTTVESTGPIVLETTSLVDSAVGQVQATVAQKIVPIGDTPAGGKFVLQDQINAIDSAKARRETVTVPSYPNLTTYDLDEQLDVVIINERTVIDHNTPYVAPPLVLTSNDRPIDQWKTLRITSRMANLPPVRTEYKTQQFTFPAILDSVVVKTLNLGFGRVPISDDESEYKTAINKYVSVQPVLRPALSIPASIRIVTTFYSSQPTPDPIFQISTQSVSFNGSLFAFNFGDVIMNSLTIGPITASSFDMRYSGLSESISFPASIPSRTSYQAQIGQEKVIFSDVEYYRSGIWFKRTGYVTLK
jgi:hypothetical protein